MFVQNGKGFVLDKVEELTPGLLIDRIAPATAFIRRHYAAIMRIGGGMLVLVGILLVSGLWLQFTIWLRVTIPGFETAL